MLAVPFIGVAWQHAVGASAGVHDGRVTLPCVGDSARGVEVKQPAEEVAASRLFVLGWDDGIMQRLPHVWKNL